MKLRTVFLLLILGAIAAFSALNWNHFIAPTTLSLGLTEIQAPLGVIMLGVVAFLTAFFLVFVVYVQASALFDSRRHAQELLHEAAESEALGMEGLLRWLESTRAEQADARGVRELRLESDDEAVQVVTVHRSKGLEYDIVLCPTLWSVRRVDASAPVLVHEGERVVFDHGSAQRETRIAEAERERLAEIAGWCMWR
jgi:ATP-dependent exoDNAse (exonuclease V) beta subunit (contains helicase and exonuclease domains)